MNDVLRAVLDDHFPDDDEEAADLERLRRLATEEADPWSRALPLHLTASALVVDPPTARVLLRWHAKQGRWLQVGGHADPGEHDPWLIARREAEEETAAVGLRPWPGPAPALAQVAVVDVNAVAEEPAHKHGDLRYLLITDDPASVPPEQEGVPLRWLTIADARALADPGLLRLLDLYERDLAAE
jgi:8-oxo-dGTP pyrophosphatase MutT (NUDIX family)